MQKIENHKLDWKAEAKTVTRNTTYTPPAKSEKKVMEKTIIIMILFSFMFLFKLVVLGKNIPYFVIKMA